MDQIARPKLLRRGGANNRRDRESWQLSKADCVKLIGASRAAFDAGLPFNRYITIAWEKAGIDAQDCVAATGEFVKRGRDWLGGHGYAMPWAWVQEHGNRFGQHCHLLLHADQEAADLFRPMPLRWVKAILSGHYVAGTLQCQKLSATRSAQTFPEAYQAQLLGKLHYMMKTAPAALEEPLGMTGWGIKPWGQSCNVYGKRSGVWQGWEEVGNSLSA